MHWPCSWWVSQLWRIHFSKSLSGWAVSSHFSLPSSLWPGAQTAKTLVLFSPSLLLCRVARAGARGVFTWKGAACLTVCWKITVTHYKFYSKVKQSVWRTHTESRLPSESVHFKDMIQHTCVHTISEKRRFLNLIMWQAEKNFKRFMCRLTVGERRHLVVNGKKTQVLMSFFEMKVWFWLQNIQLYTAMAVWLKIEVVADLWYIKDHSKN